MEVGDFRNSYFSVTALLKTEKIFGGFSSCSGQADRDTIPQQKIQRSMFFSSQTSSSK